MVTRSRAVKPAGRLTEDRIPEIGLGMLLRTADMAFNRALREELATHGITFSQFQHLRQLWESDGLTQAELSRRIGIQMASSTTVLDSLEKGGLIRRVRQSRDRRKVNVFITPKGAALEDPLNACAARVNSTARQGLSPMQVARLFRTVRAITQNLNQGEG